MNHEACDLDTIGRRLEHGLPLTIKQSRWLFTQQTGRQFNTRKRCGACNGTGRIAIAVGAYEKTPRCCKCGGQGYQSERPSHES